MAKVIGIQEAIEQAKKGVVKDIARAWVEAGYTSGDFKILKDLVGDAVFDYEESVDSFNASQQSTP